MRSSPVAPPLVELGRLVGWDPLPLSVRDARRQSAPLRERLAPYRHRQPGTRRGRRRTGRGGVGIRKLDRLLRSGGGARRRRPDYRAGRGARAHGEERLGEVDVAQHALGGAPADPGRRGGGRAGPAIVPRRPNWSATLGWCRRTRGSSSMGRASQAECQAADKASALAAGTTARTLDRVLPGVPVIAIPATSPRGSDWPWRWPSWWPRPPPSCSSTSRPGVWTTRARIA